MASNDLSESAHWQNKEIENLLKIWSRKNVQNELESMHQNLPVYEKISAELLQLGINRSATSCRDKIKKLKFKYRRIREKKGHRKGSFKFYELLQSVLGDSVVERTETSHCQRSLPQQERGNGFTPHNYHPEYEQTTYSSKVTNNDSNSIIFSDSDSNSDYDHYMKGDYGSDEDYIREESVQYNETQPTSGIPHTTQNSPQNLTGSNNMFLHAGSGRVVTTSKQESANRDDNSVFAQHINSAPLNAARTAVKRRADLMGKECDFARGMMGNPCGLGGRGHHGRWHRGGKMAQIEQTFDTMLCRFMHCQRDTQEQFLASHEKQLQQHLQFELQKQEMNYKQREEERKHQMSMFQMMINSLHQTNNLHWNPLHGPKTDRYQQNVTPASGKQLSSAMSLTEAKTVWRTADAVCFDVDSTVLKDEGVDELAKFCGVGQRVAEWTKKAMEGGMSFRVALTERLNIIKPTRQQLSDFISQHPPQFSDRISDLMTALRSKGKSVYLVSGGFRSIIEPAAKNLSIAPEHIFANKLKFYYTGEYAGFDESQPTSDTGGKQKVVQLIKDRYKHKSLVMIGDGATDLEACPPAEAFIGYGGNVVRDNVKSKAAWFVTDFQELISELDASGPSAGYS